MIKIFKCLICNYTFVADFKNLCPRCDSVTIIEVDEEDIDEGFDDYRE